MNQYHHVLKIITIMVKYIINQKFYFLTKVYKNINKLFYLFILIR